MKPAFFGDTGLDYVRVDDVEELFDVSRRHKDDRDQSFQVRARRIAFG